MPMKTFLAAALLSLLALASVPSAQAAQEAPDLDPCDGGQLGADIAVGHLCVSYYWPGCNVWIEWTAIPSQDTCLYRSDPLAASASSDVGFPWPGDSTPDVQCMDVYSQTQVPGTNYWLVRRDSCSAQLYECPEGYSPPAPPCREASLLEASSASTAGCYMVYTRNDVGEYSVVRRTSCSPPEVYHCPYEGAPIGQCDPLLKDLLSLSSASAATASEPECLQMYRETDLGFVRIVSRDSCHTEHYVCDQEKADILATRSLDTSQCDTGLSAASSQPLPSSSDPLQRTCYTQGQGELQSRTCIDPNSTDCTVYRQQITGMGSSWVCYPSGESGSDW